MDTSPEHLKVAIRVRPPLAHDRHSETIISFPQPNSIQVANGEHLITSSYDAVFQPFSTQEEIFSFVEPVVTGTLKGFNCTIFAYGQTGSGKTFTMFGSDWERNNPAPQVYNKTDRPSFRGRRLVERASQADPLINPKLFGIIPRSISTLFNSKKSSNYTFYCSFLQIYNEKLYDLLQDPNREKPLNIRENPQQGIFVENLAEFVVENEEDCYYLLRMGDRNRAVRQTKMNNHSSRSHTIFQVLLESDIANRHGNLKRAKLNLCDLAGSEKYDKEGQMISSHISEMTNINKSLTTLGKVISILSSNSSAHVPYRESKLTRILSDSLAVNTRTVLIGAVSPIVDSMDETINTLKFADRARQVMVKVRKNEVSATNDDLVQNLQREIQYLKDMLQVKKNGGISELHNQLLALKEENHQLKKQLNVQLSVEEVERLRKENKKLRLELQSISTKENTQYESSLFVTEVASQDGKKNVQESIGSERAVKNSVKTSIPSAKDVEDYMRNGTNLQQILDLLRKKDLDIAADGIKNKILSEGRCPVCTLKPPCKHYESPEAIPKTESKPPRPIFNNIENNKVISLDSDSRKLDSSPIGIVRVASKYTSETRISPESMPQSQGSQISSSSVPPIFRQENRAFEPMNNIRNTYYIPRQSTQSNRSPGMRQPLSASNGANKSFELPAKLSVRYRNKSSSYQTSGGRVEEMRRSQERKVELRKAEERLETLAKIEAYREERLRREIEKLEEERRKEDEEERQRQLKEAKRRKYLEDQKRRLDTYYEERKKQEEDVKKQQESEKAKLLKDARKKQKEVSQKKQQIMEYHKKKVLIDGIITEQMEDLSNLYVENDIIRRSTSLNMKK